MKVVARTRQEQGTGASRRLRRAGFVPGIVYGSKSEPTPVSIEHNPLFHALRVEAFHSTILDLELDGKTEQVLLRDVQWHPFKPQVLHVDLQRVAGDERLTVKVPLHFVNQEVSPAVKLSSAIIGHVLNEIEVSCLPKDLPSFIEVDLSTLEATQTIHANDLKLPAGVTLVGSAADNPVLVTVTLPVADTTEGEESEEAS
ncbi:MAG: 50S ribosomal protein L25/general stress protein Ctc [Limnobacter sp.]|nr:50S ribosomal protein L25/general stress protein Ctc [Limnobacter sp.]